MYKECFDPRRYGLSTAVVCLAHLSIAGFRSNCIRSLIQFLTENGYGHPVSPKLLQSPSDSDVFRIFQVSVSSSGGGSDYGSVSACLLLTDRGGGRGEVGGVSH